MRQQAGLFHLNQGLQLVSQRQLGEAAGEFERGARIDLTNERARQELAKVLEEKMSWNRWKYLLSSARREAECECREELESLRVFAEPGELGNLTLEAEDARGTWGWVWLSTVLADIRYAFRTLRRQPAFLVAAILLLALGIGANTALCSFADAICCAPSSRARECQQHHAGESHESPPTESGRSAKRLGREAMVRAEVGHLRADPTLITHNREWRFKK